MKRFDVVLVLAVLLTIGAVGMVRSAALPTGSRGAAGSAWKLEEKQVQEKIQNAQESFDAQQLEKRFHENPQLKRRFSFFGFMGTAVMVASLGFFVQWMARFFSGHPESRLGSPEDAPWGLREVVRLLLVLVLVSHLSFLIEWFLIRTFQLKKLDNHFLALGNTLLVDAAAFLGACRLFQMKGGSLSFQADKAWEKFRFGVTHYLAFLPVLALVTLGAVMVLQALKMDTMPQPVFTIFFSENRSSMVWWLFLLVTVAGPVAEELFFRGILYGWLRTRIGVWQGLGVTAFLFAALHGNLTVFLPIFGLGLLFGWVYEQTGSLAAPIGIHVLHNSGMLMAASLLKSIS